MEKENKSFHLYLGMDGLWDNRVTPIHEAFLLGLSYFYLGNSNVNYI